MFYSKKFKKFNNIKHCFFLEKEDFQKEFTKASTAAKDQKTIK